MDLSNFITTVLIVEQRWRRKMSKYNKGDKFELEIEHVRESAMTGRNALYRIKGFSSLVFDDYGLSLLKQVKTEEVETEPDWTKVSVDTPILVRNSAG